MNAIKIIELMNEIEKTFPVNEWMVNGVRVWPSVRLDICNKLLASETTLYEEKKSKNNLGSKLKTITFMIYCFCYELYIKIINFWKNNNELKKSEVVFLDYNGGRNLKTELKEYYNFLLNPIMDKLIQKKHSTSMLEYVTSYPYRVPVYGGSSFIQANIDFIIMANKVLFKISRIFNSNKNQRVDFRDYEKFVAFFNKRNLSSVIERKEQCIKKALLIIRLSKFFKRCLKKRQAKIGITESYDGVIGYSFNLACFELNIPSMDIQHGLAATSYHRSYTGWFNVPQNGYALLPKYFWCWDEADAEIINQWCAGSIHQPIVGGNVLAEFWKDNSNPLVKYYDRVFREFQFDKNCVLYTLQKGIKIEAELIDAIFASQLRWQWIVRLHPCMVNDIEYITKLFSRCEHVFIDLIMDFPLGMWLRNVDAHVTMCSATVKDIKEFGVHSVCVSEVAENLFECEIKQGFVKIACKTEEILMALDDQIKRKTAKQGCEKLNNGVDFIRDILVR